MTEPFYKFYECDYYATGEGRSIWLMVDRNYGGTEEKFMEFVGSSYYYPSITELTQAEFMEKHNELLPHFLKVMVYREDQPFFEWKQAYYWNYS